MPDGMRPQGLYPVRALAPAELRVLAVLRAWMAAHRAPARRHPDWQAMLVCAGFRPSGTLGFGLLMSVLTRDAGRVLDVRGCAGAELGRDEAMLLDLLAALQRGDALSALGGLAEWLAPEELPAALRGARAFAHQATAAGLHLAPGSRSG
ncbi:MULTISPECIES: hypothetical protein [Roseomonadaceae]|uniref:Uncharacterized protein n=1 Tax=Falsiroseomonas oleicola TaxID=2801474 RepID=A0ABS6H3W8_9PROT|nr:hypothetical protein [Roseomonas oleicola]MBU8542532.1 hypothetical protein [Roseomonas oleicola]